MFFFFSLPSVCVCLCRLVMPSSNTSFFDSSLICTERRMYTSSSFYSSSHPSMEEQVELARQISHSLSADTNSTSKGQSMYVKRRNRSSKWIHEGISILHWPVSTSVPSVCQCPPPQTMSKKKKS